jgi:hypothetical protein
MYLLYVDESGDTGRNGSKHLILAGAARFEGRWRWVRNDIETLLAKYFPNPVDRPRELHASEVRKGRGPYSKLTQGQREQLRDEACAILTRLGDTDVALYCIVPRLE